MKISELKTSLKNGDIKTCYFVCGEEGYLMNLALTELKNCPCVEFPELNIQEMKEDGGYSELVRALDTPPFMSSKRIVFCDIADLDADTQTKLVSFLPQIPGFSALVVKKNGKADKRKALEKELLKNTVVECSFPRESDMVDYICSVAAAGLKKISRTAAAFLLSYVDADMGMIMSELDKLICVCEKEISSDDVKKYCIRADTYNAYLLHGLMLDKKLGEAKSLTEEILKHENYPLGLLSLISSNFDLMLMARACREAGYSVLKTVNTLVDNAGVKTFRAEKAVEQCVHMDSGMLRRSIVMLSDADYKVKHGEMDIAGDLFGLLCRVYHAAG